MRKITLFISTIIVFAISLYACKKKNPTVLPDVTQTGALTFGYMEGGVVKSTYGMMKSGFTNDGHGVKYEIKPTDSSVQIFAQNTSQNWYIICSIKKVTPGVYEVNGEDNFLTVSKNWGGNTNPAHTVFEAKPTVKGTLTITKYDGNILAGTFNLKAINAVGEIIELKDGRFDIKSY